MKRLSSLALLAAIITSPAYAADMTVSITNLTRGLHFTPILVSAHNAENKLFEAGSAASASLQMMAEGGSIAGLVSELGDISATIIENPAAGLLGPGQTAMTNLNTDAAVDNTHLSVVAMLLPTNDGFMGLNASSLPTESGTYTYYVNAYDAGTEANDEIRGSGAPGEAGFPAPGPIDASAGMNGTGISATAESFVHIHRNSLGDSDQSGGSSDINNSVHRWLNPVAMVIVTIN